MKSRRAKILVPLALELAFALVVFVAIRATDGGRYGLGAKAALSKLRSRYQRCQTFSAEVGELQGSYPQCTRRMRMRFMASPFVLTYKAPARFAGSVYYLAGTCYWVQNDLRTRVLIGQRYADIAPLSMPGDRLFNFCFPRRVPLCYLLLRRADTLGPKSGADADYVELRRGIGEAGRRCDVLVFRRGSGEREVWVDSQTQAVVAVVNFPEGEPWTELYRFVVFDQPVPDELFDVDDEDLKEVKAWVASPNGRHPK